MFPPESPDHLGETVLTSVSSGFPFSTARPASSTPLHHRGRSAHGRAWQSFSPALLIALRAFSCLRSCLCHPSCPFACPELEILFIDHGDAIAGIASSRQEHPGQAGLFGNYRFDVVGLESRRRLRDCPDLFEEAVQSLVKGVQQQQQIRSRDTRRQVVSLSSRTVYVLPILDYVLDIQPAHFTPPRRRDSRS